MSENSQQVNEKVRGQIDIIEDNNFSYATFQVVRGEYFAHVFEPSITFCDSKVYVNTTCIKMVPDTDYAQILIDEDTKRLAVRPCSEDERDSFRWCSATAKRTPKQVTCRPLFAMLCDKMGWNPDYRYKFVGKLIRSNGELLYVFDISSPEIYLREITEEGKVKSHRNPTFPEQWKNQFGIPASQHASQTKINVFDGYTVFTITDPPKKGKKGNESSDGESPAKNKVVAPNDSNPKSSMPTKEDSTTPPATVVLEAISENNITLPQDLIQNNEPEEEADDITSDSEERHVYEQLALTNIGS